MKLNLYVLVSDMERAVVFYRQLFEQKPVMQSERFVAFDINGALYGLFNAAYFPYPVTVGNNCTPNIYVKDIQAAYDHVKACAPSFIMPEVVASGPYQLFVFADPDGNSLEYYTEASAGRI